MSMVLGETLLITNLILIYKSFNRGPPKYIQFYYQVALCHKKHIFISEDDIKMKDFEEYF